MNISKKDSESIQNGILRYQKILASAKARDLNESDTVTIIPEMLNDVCRPQYFLRPRGKGEQQNRIPCGVQISRHGIEGQPSETGG